MTIKDATVARVRQLCRDRHMRPNDLANRAGVTPSSVYSMLDERRREVSLNLIMRLCDGFGMTIREFFDDEHFDSVDSV